MLTIKYGEDHLIKLAIAFLLYVDTIYELGNQFSELTEKFPL
jgi:hypothetical protein